MRRGKLLIIALPMLLAAFIMAAPAALAASPHFKKGGEPVCTFSGTSQNKVLEGPATSDTAIPASAIKNGNLTFTTNPATLTAAATVSGATAGCPNPNWSGVNPVLTLTSITLDIFQPVTTQIFHCTASDPNGLTSPVTLTCVAT